MGSIIPLDSTRHLIARATLSGHAHPNGPPVAPPMSLRVAFERQFDGVPKASHIHLESHRNNRHCTRDRINHEHHAGPWFGRRATSILEVPTETHRG